MVSFYRSRRGLEYVALDASSRFEFSHEGRTVVNFARCRIATNDGVGRPSAVKTIIAAEGILRELVAVRREDVPAEWLTWLDQF